MASLLWIVAVAIVMWAIVSLLSGATAAGLVLIGVALIVASGGARVLHV